jgi:hypothetical protein
MQFIIEDIHSDIILVGLRNTEQSLSTSDNLIKVQGDPIIYWDFIIQRFIQQEHIRRSPISHFMQIVITDHRIWIMKCNS